MGGLIKLKLTSKHHLGKKELTFFKIGQGYKIKKSFIVKDGNIKYEFKKEEIFFLFNCYNPVIDRFEVDKETDILVFRTQEGKEKDIALPGDEKFLSEEYFGKVKENVNPSEISPPFFTNGKYYVSENFVYEGQEFYMGEKMKYLNYTFSVKDKKVKLKFLHESKKKIEFIFPFLSLQKESSLGFEKLKGYLVNED